MFRRLVHRAPGVVVAVLLLGGEAPCRAGVLPAAPAPGVAEAAARDLVLTIQARRALLLDRELAPLNLGVRVRNRVAILWGPVPSAELAFKAEVCLRGVVELLDIRNELFVTDDVPDPPAGAPTPMYLPPEAPPGLPALPPERTPPPLPPPPPPRPVVQPPPPADDEIELPPVRLPRSK